MNIRFYCSGAPENVYLEATLDGVVVAPNEHREDGYVNSNNEIVLRPNIGQKVSFRCLEGTIGKITNPVPEFTFLKNGIPIVDGLSVSSPNILSLLANANEETYTCEANNQLGSQLSNSIVLEIQRKLQKHAKKESFCLTHLSRLLKNFALL